MDRFQFILIILCVFTQVLVLIEVWRTLKLRTFYRIFDIEGINLKRLAIHKGILHLYVGKLDLPDNDIWLYLTTILSQNQEFLSDNNVLKVEINRNRFSTNSHMTLPVR